MLWGFLQINSLFSDMQGVPQEISLNPPHLPNPNGQNLQAALIPFCSYQSNETMLGQTNPELNLTVCDNFQPILLQGQICYSLNMTELGGSLTRSGKTSGLLLFIDPNGEFTEEEEGHESFKVYLHTLSVQVIDRPGSYSMSSLKKITATDSFYGLSDEQRGCHVGSIEHCQAEKYRVEVQSQCGCVPWQLADYWRTDKVVFA